MARKADIVDRNNVEGYDDVEMMIPFGGSITVPIQDTLLITLGSTFKTPPPSANAPATKGGLSTSQIQWRLIHR